MSDITLQELEDMVTNINQEVFEYLEKKGKEDDAYIFDLALISTGFIIGISLNNHMIWHTDEDEREILDDIDDYEPLEPFIRKKIMQYYGLFSDLSL